MVTVIGITGASGSGKSFVSENLAAKLRERGYSVLLRDADKLAKIIRDEDSQSIEQIKRIMGPEVYGEDGISIPSKISAILWDPEKQDLRQQYEAIFLNRVPEMIEADIRASTPRSVLILDFFNLFSYLEPILDHIDKTVLVFCDAETQIARLTGDGRRVPEELARKRVAEQLARHPISELKERVDLAVENGPGASVSFDDIIQSLGL